MVEALDNIIDRHPKGKPRKIKNYTIEKIGRVHILIKKMRGKRKSDIARPHNSCYRTELWRALYKKAPTGQFLFFL